MHLVLKPSLSNLHIFNFNCLKTIETDPIQKHFVINKGLKLMNIINKTIGGIFGYINNVVPAWKLGAYAIMAVPYIAPITGVGMFLAPETEPVRVERSTSQVSVRQEQFHGNIESAETLSDSIRENNSTLDWIRREREKLNIDGLTPTARDFYQGGRCHEAFNRDKQSSFVKACFRWQRENADLFKH